MAVLSALPNELLSLVTNHLERPRDVLNLSLTSQRLYEFAKLDGWKAFLKGRFGVTGLDSDARNTVHGLTTLYRNWDRKAFLARYLEPNPEVMSVDTWEKKRWRGPQGQTMGYQPKVDSYEELRGTWADRREVLTWSAGTHLVMRIKDTGAKAADDWEQEHEENAFDHYRHAASWYTYQISESREGRDDITALKLLKPRQKPDASECIALGTASGDLELLSVDLACRQSKAQPYVTLGRPVGSISISPDDMPLIATTLGDSSLALYPVNTNLPKEEAIHPLSRATPEIHGARDGRLWSCNFLSKNRLAVGIGPTYEPIHVYEITPNGFSTLPLRRFSLDSKFWGGVRNGTALRSNTSVYPIIPVSNDSLAGSEAGNVFLSGGYDGIIRLHDLRSPHGFETMFWDVTNDSSVYSLAMQGLERVVAGTSMHSMLKVFDLRSSGSHAYHSISVTSSRNAGPRARAGDYTGNKIVSEAIHHAGTSPISGGWNLFLHPRNQVRHGRTRSSRTEDSPVYSLSIPSPTSPSLYAGVEGAVMSLDFLSILDKHPDPLFSRAIERFPDSNNVDIKRSYNPSDDVLNLGMYEQGNEEALGMQLMVQDGVGMGVERNAGRRDYARFKGLDERWKDPSDERDRWSRGQEPHGWREGRTGRGRRGSRGRGRPW